MYIDQILDIALAQQLTAVMSGIVFIALGVFVIFREQIKENKLKSRMYKDDLGRADSFVGKMIEQESTMTYLDKLERELVQARMKVTAQLFIVWSVVFALVLVIIGNMIFPTGLFIPIYFAIGFVVPRFYIKSKREKFISMFDEEMVKALRRMAAVLRVGGSLEQALSDVIKAPSIPEIVKYEFSRVYASYKAGFSIIESFYELYKNIGSKDTLYLCVAMDIQMETGGDKALIIEGIANTITEKNLKQRRVKSKLAEINASVKIMAIMPVVFGVIIMQMNPDHMLFFTQDLKGQVIGMALLSAIIGGFFIMKKMSKVEM